MSRSARPWLAPLTPLYRLAILARDFGLRTGIESTHRLRWPVVSIGSLSAGGAGKTPLTLALARALTQRSMHSGVNGMRSGINIDILSRGYGRQTHAPARVDPSGTAKDFGDEPLLLARTTGLPVFVAADRYNAGLLAERDAGQLAGISAESISRTRQTERHEVSGHDFSRADAERERMALKGHDRGTHAVRGSRADAGSKKDKGALAPEGNFSGIHLPGIHLLDDGFQHRRLHRDVDIVLVSARDLHDRLLPAGNLREPLGALRRATILAIPAGDAELAAELSSELGWTGPIWRLNRRMEIPPVDGSVVAFCGIARPAQFFEGLKNAGVELAAQIAFPDHHRYTQADLDRLVANARRSSAAAFVTTEKDRVRLGPLTAQLEQTVPLATASLHIEIEDESAMLDDLLASLNASQ